MKIIIFVMCLMVGRSVFASALSKAITSEMICARTILQHNIGEESGYQFVRKSFQEALTHSKDASALNSIAEDCYSFLKSNVDPGFDKEGHAVEYASKNNDDLVSIHKNDTTENAKLLRLMRSLIMPEVRCETSGGGAAFAGSFGLGFKIDGKICSSSDGSMFQIDGAEAAFTGGLGLGGVVFPLGVTKDYIPYTELHKIVRVDDSGLDMLGAGLVLGVTTHDKPNSRNIISGVGIGVGIGAVSTIKPKEGYLILPISRSFNFLMKNSFVEITRN